MRRSKSSRGQVDDAAAAEVGRIVLSNSLAGYPMRAEPTSLLKIANMSRREAAQLNIRSTFARDRVRELARRMGMTATEIVEDALRGYIPPSEYRAVGALVQRGPLLVFPAGRKRMISLPEAQAALETVRSCD